MTYPLNKEEFVAAWKQGLNKPDLLDQVLAEALVEALNTAYSTGFEAGKQNN